MNFTREPVAWLEGAKVLLASLAVFVPWGLSGDVQASIVAIGYGVLGVAQALKTRPIAPAAFVALFTAVAGFAAHFGLEFTAEQSAGVVAAISAVFALQTRPQVTPTERV